MENGKWKTQNGKTAGKGKELSALDFPLSASENCPACGADIPRNSARFCNVCGKLLLEDYQPLDNLRSSYGLQGKSFDFAAQSETPEKNLFELNKNGAAQMAWACFAYSMVPYLGVLFIPLTFSLGGFGYLTALRRPEIGGGKLSLTSIYLSFIVLAIQIFLWWLLYFVPKIPNL